MIHQPRETKRLFPVISDQLYYTIKNNSQSESQYKLFNPSVLESWWKKNIGSGCSPSEQLTRVLYFQEEAIKSELNAKYLKADFFWEKAYNLFFKKIKDRDFLNFSDNSNLKDIIIKELFIDLHLAFFKGIYESLEEKKKLGRAERHLKYTEELLDQISLDSLIPFTKNFARFKVKIYSEIGEKGKAIQCAQNAAQRFKEDPFFEHQAVLLEAEKISAEINETENIVEEKIKNAINKLESLREKMPREKTLYTVLGEYYVLLMSLQSKTGNYPHALLSLRKAVAYEPNIIDYDEWWKALTEQMEIINKTHAPELLKKVNAGHFSLTPVGEIMLQNYQLNYTLVNAFANSQEEMQLIHSQVEAGFWQLCQIVGIPENQLGEDWLTTAKRFNNLISKIIEQKPKTKKEIHKMLQDALASQDISGFSISEKKITNLIISNLNNTLLEPENDNSEEQLEWIPFKLTPKYLTMKKSSEPFVLWWFSRKDLISKFFLSASVMLLIIIGIQTVKQNQAKLKRDSAYQAIALAIENQTELFDMTDYYEQFLTNPPIFGKDERLNEIITFYEEQFGKWFIESEEPDLEQLRRFQIIYSKMNK